MTDETRKETYLIHKRLLERQIRYMKADPRCKKTHLAAEERKLRLVNEKLEDLETDAGLTPLSEIRGCLK